jgi:hypothetical protein
MLSTIEFNHQMCRVTDEVGDVVLDRNLTPESGSNQPMIAQL